MELSVSNIAWDILYDEQVYHMMRKYNYTALEIAPTRIFPKTPYDRLDEARDWSMRLSSKWGLKIASMQSIWYGRDEKVFGTVGEREILYAYTQKAVKFASAIHCNNLVFGCPKNRAFLKHADTDVAVAFFRKMGNMAAKQNAVIAMEANPPIYNTNYINDTKSALQLVRQVNSRGFLLNLDVGTMIENEESIEELTDNVKYIHHVHISEPGLKVIKERSLHGVLKKLLEREGYRGYISIEMGKIENMDVLEYVMKYVADIFR